MITVEKILQDRTMVSLTLMLVIATISASIQQVYHLQVEMFNYSWKDLLATLSLFRAFQPRRISR